MLAGALCASCFLASLERRFMAVTAALGAGMALVGKAMPSLSPNWRADPATFLMRLGIVLMLLAICWLYGLYRQPPRSVLLDVSRESLFVYVVHLTIIYAPIMAGVSLVSLIGKTRTPLECALGSVVLAALMIGGARAWSMVKSGAKS